MCRYWLLDLYQQLITETNIPNQGCTDTDISDTLKTDITDKIPVDTDTDTDIFATSPIFADFPQNFPQKFPFYRQIIFCDSDIYNQNFGFDNIGTPLFLTFDTGQSS
eukprot:TRINITY_DN33897_c0_g2_i1.p5 TRINITY_DN33897_c0_g2~~TRINITY_DN33897_c0_g2_i1.p5  ORF type:complete len:107 (-),score=6.79 TRINITY_DN33897_c0_g2_i1:577-897(-)